MSHGVVQLNLSMMMPLHHAIISTKYSKHFQLCNYQILTIKSEIIIPFLIWGNFPLLEPKQATNKQRRGKQSKKKGLKNLKLLYLF